MEFLHAIGYTVFGFIVGGGSFLFGRDLFRFVKRKLSQLHPTVIPAFSSESYKELPQAPAEWYVKHWRARLRDNEASRSQLDGEHAHEQPTK